MTLLLESQDGVSGRRDARTQYVLGLNENHDASAALVRNGRVIRAIAAERLTGQKHGSDGLDLAVNYVLDAEGITREHLDLVVTCAHHQQSDGGPGQGAVARTLIDSAGGYYIHRSHHDLHAYSTFYTSPFTQSAILVIDGMGSSASPTPSAERYSHVPLLRAATLDSQYYEAETLYVAIGRKIDAIGRNLTTRNPGDWAHEDIGIGRLYSHVTKAIFTSRYDAGKTMALATS